MVARRSLIVAVEDPLASVARPVPASANAVALARRRVEALFDPSALVPLFLDRIDALEVSIYAVLAGCRGSARDPAMVSGSHIADRLLTGLGERIVACGRCQQPTRHGRSSEASP